LYYFEGKQKKYLFLGAADARKSFIEGSAYQGSVEKKTVEPLDVQ
jgi:hypothetical protein